MGTRHEPWRSRARGTAARHPVAPPVTGFAASGLRRPLAPPALDGDNFLSRAVRWYFRANSEKEFQLMCSICATIWVMVDGALEPVMLCTQTLFGC